MKRLYSTFEGSHYNTPVRRLQMFGRHLGYAQPAYHTLEAKELKTIKGVIIAEAQPFRDSRGQFSRESLNRIVELMKANDEKFGGTRTSLGHDAGVGFHVGRCVRPRLSSTSIDGATVACCRADLVVSAAASISPVGDLASYVEKLADEGTDILMMSLVLRAEQFAVRGEPPIWMPTQITAVDLVSIGAATNSLLGCSRQDRLAAAVREMREVVQQICK